MLDEAESAALLPGKGLTNDVDDSLHLEQLNETSVGGVIRTLDGEEIDDEFAQDALNYQILLNKIDLLLDRLKLDA